jgi:5-methylcytosine-specific restriction endonuclease McrA
MIFSDEANQRIRENKCPTCGKPKCEWKRRTSWRCCSTKCTQRFYKEHVTLMSWQSLRKECFERDGWRCVKCGAQPTSLIRDGYETLYTKVLKTEYMEEYCANMATIVGPLIADHIKPIALGGEQWGLNNLQTLCSICNKDKTASDIKKIAKLRNIEKKLSKGQSQLKKFK